MAKSSNTPPKVRCQVCRKVFAAQRRSAKYCGDTCRQRARRSGSNGGAAVVTLVGDGFSVDVEVGEGEAAPADPPLVASVMETLRSAGRLETWQGQAALVLARQACSTADTGSAKAAVMRQLDATMAEALKGAGRRDEIDELEERMRRKLEGSA